MSIEEINEQQYKLLFGAANFEVKAFAVIGPLDNDDPEKRANLQQQWSEVEDLHGKGLVDDISEKFPANVEAMKQQTGRQCKIFKISNIAQKMFQGCDGRLPC